MHLCLHVRDLKSQLIRRVKKHCNCVLEFASEDVQALFKPLDRKNPKVVWKCSEECLSSEDESLSVSFIGDITFQVKSAKQVQE